MIFQPVEKNSDCRKRAVKRALGGPFEIEKGKTGKYMPKALEHVFALHSQSKIHKIFKIMYAKTLDNHKIWW